MCHIKIKVFYCKAFEAVSNNVNHVKQIQGTLRLKIYDCAINQFLVHKF